MLPRVLPSLRRQLFRRESLKEIVMTTQVPSVVRTRAHVHAPRTRPSVATAYIHGNLPIVGTTRRVTRNLVEKVPKRPRNPDSTLLNLKVMKPLLIVSSLLFLHWKLNSTPACHGQPLSTCTLMLIVETCFYIFLF